MADEEQDSDSDVEEYSGMEQPPLIKQLKTILAEYPDDGQIIKELVQNAEDAGALEMKILYDGRRLNTEIARKIPYRKFFKAPALCFYNNGVFSEDDWRGIKMIYSSVKEEDPLKVGRFGLGFKSVFHITENPCIISGNRILLINPHERVPDKVCITMKLKALRKCKRLKIEEFLEALNGTFGFSSDSLDTGRFEGTIFWFLLRETLPDTSSDRNKILSDTCYDGCKVMDLFRSFQTEATHSLLFLKSLCKVEVYCRGSDTEYDLPNGDPFFTVELEDASNTIQQERQRFLQEVKKICGTVPKDDIVCVARPKLKTRCKTRDLLTVHEKQSSWLVINVYKGGKMSEKLQNLVGDKDLSYMPFVGAAVPITDSREPIKGHIFCFLPLPQEKKSLTGLPVHFNGFFALSQNRRHLKWASADQDTLHMHRDKAIEWNESLVNEVIPSVYLRLIKEMISISNCQNNSEQTVEALYRCIPDDTEVDIRWEGCVKELHEQLFGTSFIFVRKQSKWVLPSQPLYTMFYKQNIPYEQQEIVIKLLKMHKDVDFTEVPMHIWELLRKICSLKKMPYPKDISPAELCKVMKSEDIYKREIDQIQKIKLLEYIVRDKDFKLLEGLELIPLENGSFMTFHNAREISHPVYFCTKDEIALFPGLEERFVSTAISEQLKEVFRDLAKSGKYQIRGLTTTDVVSLLQKTIQQKFGNTEPVNLKPSSDRRFQDWLEKLWPYIFNQFSSALSHFENLPLIPCLVQGRWDDRTWKKGEVHLYKMNHTFLVKYGRDTEEVSDNICKALKRLSVKILPSLPEWFDARKIPCVFNSSGVSVVRMLERLSTTQCISDYNSKCQLSDAEAMIALIEKISSALTVQAIRFLQRLKLFKETVSATDQNYISLSSIAENSQIVHQDVSIPVHFPRRFLIANSFGCLSVARKLEAYEVSEDQLVIDVLEAMNCSSYHGKDVQIFMMWFLTNIYKFKSKSNILSLSGNIAFVPNGAGKQKPSELYDPRNDSLKSLFSGECKFPIEEFCEESRLNALKYLGLRNRGDVSSDCLYATAIKLNDMSAQNLERKCYEQKAKSLLHMLEERHELLCLPVTATGRQLHTSILHLKCLPHKKDKPDAYPANFTWEGTKFALCSPSELKSVKFSEIVGSVIPLIKFNSEILGGYFSWNSQPEATMLVQQLKNLILAYNGTNKSMLLPLLFRVYNAMTNTTTKLFSCQAFQDLLQGNCIWWGDGFCSPNQTVLEKRKEDIDLRPYMYTLPTELEPLKSFFCSVGCNKMQNVTILLKVLDLIDTKYNAKDKADSDAVQKDLNIVLQILSKLCQDNVNSEQYGDKVLFPVHTGDERTLVLKPYSQCTYCDAKWLKEIAAEDEDDDEILYIHTNVPSEVAECLGVKSLKRHLMSDAEGLEEWGQEEPLTRRLHNILKDGYVDGLAVPKEIIQNADDALASKVHLVYDERQNTDARTQLLDDGMADCQGPALWAYNDALFTDSDLRNITKLSGATKESDTTKIGKFGLGFCAVYNLTDVPSFLSGQNMVLFDPHTKYLNKALPGKSPGLKINLKTMKNKRLMKKMHNQFKPFQNMLGCDLFQSDPYFNGTLFRLPLRTQQQAAVSEIKNISYNREEMIRLLQQFVEACGNMLLFTQNVKELKLYHIPPSGVTPESAELLCTVSKELVFQTLNKTNKTVLSICSELKVNRQLQPYPFAAIQKVQISIKCEEYMRMIASVGSNFFETHWLISWATGTSKALQLSYSTNITGALPLGSVAILVKSTKGCICPESLKNVTFGFYKTGHVFCYLPLPIQSGFDFHVNGSFAVTSNRRGLQTNTEDDKYSYETLWNEAVLSDAISRSFINILEKFHEYASIQFDSLSPDYKFYQFWPVSNASVTGSFKRGFYQNLILTDSIVFESYGDWLGLSHCIFLNKAMSQNTEIADIAFSTLQKFRPDTRFGAVKMPSKFVNELDRNREWREKANIVDEEQFFVKYFLPNICDSYWNESKESINSRNKLLLYCLEHSTLLLDTLLRETECIPTKPDGKLKRPPDLIHPHDRVAKLFDGADGRFPGEAFSSYSILRKLVFLGMMKDEIPPDLVLERAKTVSALASKGLFTPALERCNHMITYLLSCQDLDQEILLELSEIKFLPVLNRPSKWSFQWHADSCFCKHGNSDAIYFEKASRLFFENCKYIVGCTELLLDSARLPHSAFSNQLLVNIGVKAEANVSIHTVVDQLLVVCRAKEVFQNQVEDGVFEKIYSFLDKSASLDSDNFASELPRLKDSSIILLNSDLLPVSKVAFSVGFNCFPELYEIGRNRINKHRTFLRFVGVKEEFNVQDVLEVLKRKKIEFDNVVLPPNALQLVHQLLELLTDLMRKSNLKYQDITDIGEENIVAPDIEQILRPTHMLCLDDLEFTELSKSMRFVHSDISRSVAEKIGISTKRNKYILDCSLGMPYEQKEDLVTRLNGLLDGYPCDIGIMKELIQNADDANASEIHFVKDFRTHSCRKIFEQSYEEFQGPALLVFNDSPFTQTDLKGLANLGVGSKQRDPAKSGQYGVGFNAVYHLTDFPSFITKGIEIEGGETLCIFDPLKKFFKTTGGMRFGMSKIRNAFPDVVSGYSDEQILGHGSTGTTFRFPLRQTASELGQIMTQQKINTILADLKAEMSSILLFLRSIMKVTVSDISSGYLKREYSVSVELSEDDLIQRKSFADSCKERANQVKTSRNFSSLSPAIQVKYRMQLKDSNKKIQDWIIVQKLGLSEEKKTEEVKEAFEKEKLGMLPVGGVAVKIPEKIKAHSSIGRLWSYLWNKVEVSEINENGKIYCFLPLPVKTGLPMHVNGHFILDHEARRSLWVEEKGFKSAWNYLLLSDNVAHSYVEALNVLKSIIFDKDYKKELYTKDKFIEDVTVFDQYFPISKRSFGEYERYLVKNVFEIIKNEGAELFPISTLCQSTTEKTSVNAYQVRWSSFHPEGHHFSVFATRTANVPFDTHFDDLLKALGLKLTYITDEVVQSMSECGCSVPYYNANVVIQYLKSYKLTSSDKIQLETLPCPVGDTKFGSVVNVRQVIRFCASVKTFKNELDGLPLLVTNDSILKCFDMSQIIYCTEFCRFLDKSAPRFVHTDLVSDVCVLNVGEEMGVKEDIEMKELENFLSCEVDRTLYTREDSVKFNTASKVLGSEMIKNLWDLIARAYFRSKAPKFDVYLEPVHHWCLLPALTGKHDNILTRISRKDVVLDMESFKGLPSLECVLRKLRLPTLDRLYLSEDAIKLFLPSLASLHNPVALLVCLKYYRDILKETNLKSFDCSAILIFFYDQLRNMQTDNKAEEWWIRDSLRLLPIYIAQDGTRVSVENKDIQVIVLPKEMPVEGVSEWASSTGRTLLQEQLSLKPLYTFLQFTFTSTIDIYLECLLTSWEYLPFDATIAHLVYIRDVLLQKGVGQEYNAKQKRLIEILRESPVIPKNNERKKASEFFHPGNEIFRKFCSKEGFPPSDFSDAKWETFLDLIGIRTEVTDVEFIRFAKQVSYEGSQSINGEVEMKSSILLGFLLNNDLKWNSDIYSEISHIKFIVPHIAAQKLTEVHRQYTENRNLICFNGSISYRHEHLTWTSLPLLPKHADPCEYLFHPKFSSQKEKFLGIHQKPPLNRVILHCQNVCDSLKVCLADSTMSKRLNSWLDDFMEKMYDWLLHNALSTQESKQRLYHTPIVYISEHETMIPAHQTAITIFPDQEIVPYLVQAPIRYGKFRDLFLYLGAVERPTYILYVQVLAQIKAEVEESVLDNEYISAWLAISGAVDNLFKQLGPDRTVNNPPEGTILYLPTRGKQLVNSSDVIVSDNAHQEKRINDSLNLNYFIGFKELDLKHGIFEINWLPKQIRPKRLTQILSEEIDMSDVREVLNSEEAQQLERLFQSTDFIQGVLRLLKHAKTRKLESLLPEEEIKISSELQDVQVRCVNGLKTYLFLQDNRIETSAEERQCYFEHQDEKWWIYFHITACDEQEWLRDIADCLVRFVIRVAGKDLRENALEVNRMVHMVNNISQISLILDRMKIDAYDLPQDIFFFVFPRPGTYVPVDLHHLLNCEISCFGVHEYKCVAFELEDNLVFNDLDNSDSYNPVYIYVRIIKKVSTGEDSSALTEMYEINTGDERIIVPAFRLFKFIRPSSDVSSTDMVSVEGPKPSVTAQAMNKEKYSIRFTLLEAWKLPEEADRKRVIGRLMRRWHPDKNLGNEEFCNELFIYLRDCIVELENGGSTHDDETDGHQRQSRAYPDFTHSQYYRFCESMGQRSNLHKAQAQRYYAGNTSNHSRYSAADHIHSESSKKEYHDYGEAHRWYRQAEVDLRQACKTIDTPGEPSAFNWICYMCHQATEKSLKAAWFSKDANKVPRLSHDIRAIAMMIGSGDISNCVDDLADLTGNYAKMRYPDKVNRPQIPSTVYTREQAERSCNLAQQILNLVKEEYIP